MRVDLARYIWYTRYILNERVIVMRSDFATEVYNTLTGMYIPGTGIIGVENAFKPGQDCYELYEAAYEAYHRLCDRLREKDEDDDLEIIFHAFLPICRIVGLKMYDYGGRFSDTTDDGG